MDDAKQNQELSIGGEVRITGENGGRMFIL